MSILLYILYWSYFHNFFFLFFLFFLFSFLWYNEFVKNEYIIILFVHDVATMRVVFNFYIIFYFTSIFLCGVAWHKYNHEIRELLKLIFRYISKVLFRITSHRCFIICIFSIKYCLTLFVSCWCFYLFWVFYCFNSIHVCLINVLPYDFIITTVCCVEKTEFFFCFSCHRVFIL